MIRPDAKRNLGIGAILLMVLVLIGLYTAVTDTTPPSNRSGGTPMVGFGPNGGKINKLTDAPAGCTVTEGAAVTCTISISPAAPASASFTFNLTPRIIGAGAWTVRDSARTPVGGTGADITTTTGGTSYCVQVPAGATSVTFPIVVVDDNIAEATETIVATITGATNLTIGTSSTTITVLDNDNRGTFDVTAYGATVNNSSNDDAAGIQAAVNAAAAVGRGIVYFPAGTYDVYGDGFNTVINVPPAAGLTFLGYGSTVKMKGGGCAGAKRSTSGGPVCGHRMFSTGGGKSSGYNGVANSSPLVFAGLTLDGNRQNQAGPWQYWESEQSHLLFVGGWSEQQNKGRIVTFIQDVDTKNSPADGMSFDVKVDVTTWHTTHTDDYRGGFVATGGGSKFRIRDITTRTVNSLWPSGIDVEIDQIGSIVGGIYDFSMDLSIDGAVIDGDMDIGGYITPEWFTFCWTSPTTCGTGSTQTYNNVTMLAGPFTIQSTGKNDVLNITNSTLRSGRFVSDVNRAVYNTGQVNITDTNFYVDNSPTWGIQGSPSGWHATWSIPYNGGVAKPPWPSSVNFLRSNIQVSNTYGAPASPCFFRQYDKTSYDTFTITNSTIGAGWASECPSGYTGTATVTGSGTPNALPANPSVPSNQLACDGSAPVTTTTTATTSTTIAATTTTAAPSTTNRVEVESCTLGANVINWGTSIYGNGSVGSGTTATCTVTNSGSAGTYAMVTRYDTAGPFTRTVTVNGTAYPTAPGLTYTATSGWDTISNNVVLTTGSNTIVIEASYITVDYFEFNSATLPTTTAPASTTTTVAATTTTPLAQDCVRQQAETGATLVNWATASGLDGYNSTGYVGDTNFTGSASWSITVPTTGTYQFRARVITGGSGAVRTLTVAGTSLGDIFVPATTSWGVVPSLSAALTAGAVTVKIEEDSSLNGIGGAMYIDYVELCLTSSTTEATTTTLPALGCMPAGRYPISTVTATSGTASALTDGSEATAWAGSSTAAQTITLDFGQARSVSKFYALWVANRAGRLMKVQYRTSTTGTWLTPAKGLISGFSSGGAARCATIPSSGTFTPFNARQVRLVISTRETSSTGALSIYEVGIA